MHEETDRIKISSKAIRVNLPSTSEAKHVVVGAKLDRSRAGAGQQLIRFYSGCAHHQVLQIGASRYLGRYYKAHGSGVL